MAEIGEIFTILGATAVIGVIAFIVFSLFTIAAAIVLLCLSIKEKGELKKAEIDEGKIKRIITLAIWSLVITIISCSGCTFLVLPILALVFASSNAKSALQEGNVLEANKKADLALLMIIISNSIILGLSMLSTIGNAVKTVLSSF